MPRSSWPLIFILSGCGAAKVPAVGAPNAGAAPALEPPASTPPIQPSPPTPPPKYPGCLTPMPLDPLTEVPASLDGVEILAPGLVLWTGPSEPDHGGPLYVGVQDQDGAARLWEIGTGYGLFGGTTVTLRHPGPRQGPLVWLNITTDANTRPGSYGGYNESTSEEAVLWDSTTGRLLAQLPLSASHHEFPSCPESCADDPASDERCVDCNRPSPGLLYRASLETTPAGTVRYGGSKDCPEGAWRWSGEGWVANP